MKRFLILIMLVLVTGTVSAQLFKRKDKTVEVQYQAGAVPVVNGKVTFEEFIPANGMSATEVEEKVNNWISSRFVKPTVIAAKRYESEAPQTAIVKSEEYIVFRNTFFVLNRARIYYYLTITAKDGGCLFNISRITYWYDDEDDKGGIHMKAENWITDDMAFNNKGKLKRFEGRFRRKTIDLKNALVQELTNELTPNK
ncbi:MAG: DUF4468 domain-containing protein [Bacteroidaceae bacterium]|nr:DUF4468 domain-containing protein [Bacteroidaceae bacterium]